jgi:2-(1,2-epoxy-1,2-dihydrophenyl)acetyl-CoA isomerase
MSSKVLVETRGAVRWIVINRPERRNALDRDTMIAIREAVVRGGNDPTVRVLVLGGAGGAFSSGADLKANSEVQSQEDMIEAYFNPAIRAIRHARKPVVAAVDGVATGFGCSLALACDVRIASTAARFSLVFVKRGLALDGGASFFLPRLAGMNGLEMVLSGDVVGAEEALRLGLVKPRRTRGLVRRSRRRGRRGHVEERAARAGRDQGGGRSLAPCDARRDATRRGRDGAAPNPLRGRPRGRRVLPREA